jgi:hypothetical protein
MRESNDCGAVVLPFDLEAVAVRPADFALRMRERRRLIDIGRIWMAGFGLRSG